MGLDFDAAKGSLKISKMQFDQLDELDGSKDGKIEESIFESALKLRDFVNQDHTPDDYKNVINDLVKNFGEAIKDKFDAITKILAKGVTHWENPGEFNGEVVDNNIELEATDGYFQTDGNDKTETPKDIKSFCKNVAWAVRSHKDLNFSLGADAVPGCEILDVNTNWVYDTETESGTRNDQLYVSNNSRETHRHPDGVEVKVTYYYNGEEHSVVYTEMMEAVYRNDSLITKEPITKGDTKGSSNQVPEEYVTDKDTKNYSN